MRPLVLIDLDGTLIDSGPGIMHSITAAFDELGFPPLTEAQQRAFVGPPLPASMRALGIPEDRISETVACYRRHFEQGGMLQAEVFPGIPEQLELLRNAGTTLAVATSKPEVYARPICDYFGLTPLLDGVYGAPRDHIPSTKATVIAHALEELGRQRTPENTIMVGDRHHDVDGAAEHGIATLGVRWGYAEPGELAGATGVISTVSDLATRVRAVLQL